MEYIVFDELTIDQRPVNDFENQEWLASIRSEIVSMASNATD